MPFKVSRISGVPSYDSLPVAKVVTYPLEKRDYRPFAQNILCVSDKFLHIRMWAFEVNPLNSSRLECVLYLFADEPELALAVVAAPASDNGGDMLGCCLLKNGQETPTVPEIEQELKKLALHPHNGEDLQGVYWGYTVDIPLTLLEKWGGKLKLNPGDTFSGNFFKVCLDKPRVHLGCYYDADFNGNPYLPPSMGEFEIVTY